MYFVEGIDLSGSLCPFRSSRMVLLKGVDEDGFVWSVYARLLWHVEANNIFPAPENNSSLIVASSSYRYTNYESRKAHNLAENPRASLLFFWEGLNRQVKQRLSFFFLPIFIITMS